MMKQVPALYVFMSGKRKVDYSTVFHAVRDLLPDNEAQEVVPDLEAAMRAGIQEVFPEKRVKGCVFYWAQALYRHVQSKGLQQAYHNDLGTRTFIRRLMALAFIPAENVSTVILNC